MNSNPPIPGLFRAEEQSVRILHWVRHGQYSHEEVKNSHIQEGNLTARGREQARMAGLALQGWPFANVYASDMLRAVQTADILASNLGGLPVQKDERMRECAPTPIPGRKMPRRFYTEAQKCLQGIFDTYFQPVQETRHELFVAHGNLIRAVVAKAMGTRKNAWLKMRMHHLALTRLLVQPDGTVMLLDFNTVGHLPHELVGEM